ncbi:RNA polymerase factor sigma-54, partial [Paraburkholderia sp. SIMBA_053]
EDDWIASPLRVAADGTVISQTSQNTSPEGMSSSPPSSSSSTSSGESQESGEPQGVDEYNGMGSDSNSDANQWNLDDYGRSGNASDD